MALGTKNYKGAGSNPSQIETQLYFLAEILFPSLESRTSKATNYKVWGRQMFEYYVK